MSEYNVQWFEEPIKDESNVYISGSLDLVNNDCPATLILLSQNMVEGMFVAGGSCITMLDKYHPFGDIDVYTKTADSERYVKDLLKAWDFKFVSQAGKNADVKKYSDGVVTVQTIHSTKIESLRALLGSYDIEACKIGFDEKEVLYSSHGADDIKIKAIRIRSTNHDIAKLIVRICKYAGKGYSVDISEIRRILDSGKETQQATYPISSSDPKMFEALSKALERGAYLPQQPQPQPGYPTIQPVDWSKFIQPIAGPLKYHWTGPDITTGTTTLPIPQQQQPVAIEYQSCSGCGKMVVKGASCYNCIGY